MELLKLAALCAVCILPVVLLRKQTPEQALLLTIAILAVAAARCVSLAMPLMDELRACSTGRESSPSICPSCCGLWRRRWQVRFRRHLLVLFLCAPRLCRGRVVFVH